MSTFTSKFSMGTLALYAIGIGVAVTSSPVEAQDGGATSILLDEIVTTARRKDDAEALQDVPVAVSAFNGDQLDVMQFANLNDITAAVPNANAEILGTYPGFVNFSMRGTGVAGSALSDEPTVGIFIDGVYQGIAAGMLLDTFDMESIEILRGPQGTFFGRNVTGGAVLMRTSAPTEEFQAKVKVKAGNLGTVGVAAVVSGPLSENVLGKVAVFHNHRDDYATNIAVGNPLAPNAGDLGEKDQQAFRGALTWLVSDSTEVTFRAERMVSDEDAGLTDNRPEGAVGADALNAGFGALNPPSNIIAPTWGDYEQTGGDVGAQVPRAELSSASVEINWDVGDGSLKSITAWRDFSQENMAQDFDNSLLPLFEIWNHTITQDQISQEFVYNKNLTDTVSMTAGLYYFDQSVSNNDFRISGGAFGGVGTHITYDVDHSVLAAFASFDVALNDRWNLSAGGRFSDEEKSAAIANAGAFAATGGASGCSADGILPTLISGMNPRDDIDFTTCTPSQTGSRDWSNFSPKVVAQYNASDDSQWYFSYSKGFRSGGFSTRGLVTTDPAYDEEGIDAFEAGIKHDFAGGSRINAAVFHNSIDDMQRNVFLSVTTGEQITRNAAKATLKGAELEAWFPLGDNFLIQGSLGYTDATYDSYNDGATDFSGNDVPFIPKWQRDVSLIWDLPMGDNSLTARAAYHFRDDYHVLDSNAGYVAPTRTTYDASISYGAERWSITAYGKNLTDKTTEGPATDVVGLWRVTQVYLPRTYGLEFIWRAN